MEQSDSVRVHLVLIVILGLCAGAVEASPLTESSIIGLSCLAGVIVLVTFFSLCCYCCRKHRLKQARYIHAKANGLKGESNYLHDQVVSVDEFPELAKEGEQTQVAKPTQNGVYHIETTEPDQPDLTPTSNTGPQSDSTEASHSAMLAGHPGLKTESWTSWVHKQPPSNADLRLDPAGHQRRAVTTDWGGNRHMQSVPSHAVNGHHKHGHSEQTQEFHQRNVTQRPEVTGIRLRLDSGSSSGKQYTTESGYTKKHVLPKRPTVESQRYIYNSAPSLRPEHGPQATVLTQSRRGISSMLSSNSQPAGGQYNRQYVPADGAQRIYFSNYKPKVLQGYSPRQYIWSDVTARPETTHKWREIGEGDTSYHTETVWKPENTYGDEGEVSILFDKEEERQVDTQHVHVVVRGDDDPVTGNDQSNYSRDGGEVTIVDYVDVVPISDEPHDHVLASLDDVLESESGDSGHSAEFRHRRQRLPHEGSVERLPGGKRRPEVRD